MNLTCPTTGQRCSYRERLPEIFTTIPLSVDTIRGDYLSTLEDERKLGRRLVEHSVAAQITESAGMGEDEKCPTAERMAASTSRRTIRGVLRFFQNKRR